MRQAGSGAGPWPADGDTARSTHHLPLSAGELYLHPRADALLLGGTHGFGDVSPSFDPQAEERILAGMAALFGPRSSTPA